MKLLPLVLSAKREHWRMDDSESADADAEFGKVRAKARERDKNTCRFCGFKQNKVDGYIQIHHLNDDHHDNGMTNLVAACMHCHANQHIGLWGAAGEAVIIFLPEIPQFQLNHLCRTVLAAKRFHAKAEVDIRTIAERNGGNIPVAQNERLRQTRDMGERAQAIFDRIRAREAKAQELLGSSDPAELGTAFLSMPEDAYAKRAGALAPFRLLLLGQHRGIGGTVDKLQAIADGWIAPGGPYAGLDPSTWARLLQPTNAARLT